MTDQWTFVAAAYAVTAAGTLALLIASWRAMQTAEMRVQRLVEGELA